MNLLAFFCIAIIWGSSASIILKFKGALPTLTLCLLVSFISLLFITPFVLYKTKGKVFNEIIASLHSELRLKYLICGFLGYFIYPICYFYSLHSGFEVQANVINYTWPLFASLISFYIGAEIVTNKKVFGVTIGMIGAILSTFNLQIYSGNLTISFFNLQAIGVFIVMFCGALSYGLYTAIFKRLTLNDSPKKLSRPSAFFLFIIVGFVGLLFINTVFFISSENIDIDLTFNKFIYIVFYALINLSLAYFIWLYLIERNSVNRLALLAFLIPVISTIILTVVSNSDVSVPTMLGLAIIVVGIYISEDIEKYINPIFSFLIFVTYFVLLSIFLKPYNTSTIEGSAIWNLIMVSISLFSIFSVFLLNRMAKTVNIEDILLTRIIVKMDNLSDFYKQAKISVDNLNYLKCYMLEIFSNLDNLNIKEITKLNRMTDKLSHELIEAHGDKSIELESLHAIKESINEWAYSKNICVSLYEWCFVLSLGIFIIALLFFIRTGNLLEECFFVMISTSIATIILAIRDYSMRSPNERRIIASLKRNSKWKPSQSKL